MDPLHPHDPPVVGPFRLRGRLGADADVRRYLAVAGDGAEVTLAVVRPSRATDPDFRAAFARRIEAVREADSAFLCPVVAAEPHGAVPWAAAARPAGESVAELLERDGAAVRSGLVPLVRGLARGLADLHAAGAAYGPFGAADLRPTGRGTGFAGPVPAADAAGAVDTARATGAARDVYAWAGLVTELAGQDGVPLLLRQLVAVCLNPDPGLRPSAADLVRMLGEAGRWEPPVRDAPDTSASPVSGEPTPTPDRKRPDQKQPDRTHHDRTHPDRKRTDRRWAGLLAGGLVLAAVAATGVVLLRDRVGTTDDAPGVEGSVTSADAGTGARADCSEAPAFPPDGAETPEDAEVEYATFSPDGDVLAVQAFRHGTALWDWRANTPTAFVAAQAEGHGRGRPHFTPDGCGITVPKFYDPDSYAPTIVTYDLVTGDVTDHVPRDADEGSLAAPAAPSVDVDTVDVGPDGSLALHLRGEGTRVVGPGGTEPVAELDTRTVSDTEFLDEDRLATRGGRAITVWDLATGEVLHKVEPVSGRHFAVGPGPDEVVYLYEDRVIRRDLTERAETDSFTLPGFRGDTDSFVIDLAVDADRDRVFITWQENLGDDEYAHHSHVWDLGTGQDVLPDGIDFRKVALHPDGEMIAVVNTDQGLDLLDPETFEVVDTITE